MTSFMTILAYCVASYATVGALVGVYIVATNLASYFLAGWRYKEMARTVLIAMIIWPAVIVSASR